MERTDAELVRQVRQGDRDAFRAIVERYQRKIYGVVVGMLHDHDAAWETAQETFIRALRSIEQFKGEAGFYTWLYRIAVNLAIDHQRRAGRQAVLPVPDETLERYEGPARDRPDHRLRSRELGERVRAALAELTPDHRAVILLREVEGLSYDEISKVMQCAKGTVMSRLHYARKRLQTLLQPYLEDDT